MQRSDTKPQTGLAKDKADLTALGKDRANPDHIEQAIQNYERARRHYFVMRQIRLETQS